jgi:predicted nucleic acid-binding protein
VCKASTELTKVARRKLDMTWAKVQDSLVAIRTLVVAVLPIDMDTHADGLRVAERDGYGIFDALLIASALRAGCGTLWSEDMRDGMVIDARLRIANPLRAAN